MPQEETKRELDIDVRDTLLITVSEYKEKMRLDLRHFYTDKNTSDWKLKPTKKGVNFLLEDTPIVIAGLIAEYEAAAGQSWEEGLP